MGTILHTQHTPVEITTQVQLIIRMYTHIVHCTVKSCTYNVLSVRGEEPGGFRHVVVMHNNHEKLVYGVMVKWNKDRIAEQQSEWIHRPRTTVDATST